MLRSENEHELPYTEMFIICRLASDMRRLNGSAPNSPTSSVAHNLTVGPQKP